MHRPRAPRSLVRASAVGLALAAASAACSTSTAQPPAALPSVSAPASSTTPAGTVIEQARTARTEVPSCAPVGAAPGDIDGWTGPAGSATPIVPILVSSQLTVGPNRFLYTVTDAEHRVVASPDTPTSVSFFALERDPGTAVATVEGAFLDTGLGHGLYRASVDLDCAGQWGAEVVAELPDGTTPAQRIRFTVHPEGTTPAIGEPAPRSETPTASTIEEVRRISTDPDPYPGAFERTVGEVVTAGQPSLVFFATPAFCQTGICGPTVALVKSVALDYRDRIGFVNVEPYRLRMTANGLQPELDADGHLQPVEAVHDYGIAVEPYLFVVDAEGDVFAKFEGVVGEDELRAAIEDVLAQAA